MRQYAAVADSTLATGNRKPAGEEAESKPKRVKVDAAEGAATNQTEKKKVKLAEDEVEAEPAAEAEEPMGWRKA